VADELSALFRRHRARVVVANLARRFGIDAAEEGFQEAAVKAPE
jgi:predicted RNA polymerase sigma factor